MKFEWDKNKNELNKAKHSISFETAESVFLDKDAVYLYATATEVRTTK